MESKGTGPGTKLERTDASEIRTEAFRAQTNAAPRPATQRLASSGTGVGKSSSKSTKKYAESIAEYHAIASVGPREHDFFSEEFSAEAVLCATPRVPMPVPSAKSFDNVSMAKKILENPFGVNNKQRTEPLAKPGISQPPPARTPPRRAMHALTAADLAELPPEQRAKKEKALYFKERAMQPVITTDEACLFRDACHMAHVVRHVCVYVPGGHDRRGAEDEFLVNRPVVGAREWAHLRAPCLFLRPCSGVSLAAVPGRSALERARVAACIMLTMLRPRLRPSAGLDQVLREEAARRGIHPCGLGQSGFSLRSPTRAALIHEALRFVL
jgi:hypothetical protein